MCGSRASLKVKFLTKRTISRCGPTSVNTQLASRTQTMMSRVPTARAFSIQIRSAPTTKTSTSQFIAQRVKIVLPLRAGLMTVHPLLTTTRHSPCHPELLKDQWRVMQKDFVWFRPNKSKNSLLKSCLPLRKARQQRKFLDVN